MPQQIVMRGPLPDRAEGVILSAEFTSNLNNSGAITFARVYVNCSNPLLANNGAATAVPYFASYAALFRKFQVVKCSVAVQFANGEAYPLIPFICPVNFLPPFATNTELQSYVSNPYAKKQLISKSGGMDRCNLRRFINIAKMSGFSADLADTGLVGNTDGSGAPANNVYAAVGTDNNGNASVLGSVASIVVTYTMDFMERQTPPT